MGPAERQVEVEVVYALPDEQVVVTVRLPPGSTIRDALEHSGISRRFPEVDFSGCRVGVFGRVRPHDSALADGDRVEIYRVLSAEPKEARRSRVRQRRPRPDGR
jgi:putative ubiquitin-RnfH superfamily antitoxin RatB of RatAB toxin-antitoxin module